jgi:hypothetical protein
MPVAGAQSIQANARARWMPSMSSASDSMFESMRVGTLASPYPPTSEATYPEDFSGKELGLWRQHEAKTGVIPGTLAAKLIVRLK